MRKILCLFMMGLISVGGVFAEAKTVGNSDETVRLQALVAAQPFQVDALMNLGILSFQKGENGRAIYYFERAKALSSRDSDIADNLQIVQMKNRDGLAPPRSRAIVSLFEALSLPTWVFLLLVLITLALIGFVFGLIRGRRSLMWNLFGGVGLGLLIVVPGLSVKGLQVYTQKKGVVVVSVSVMHQGPGSAFPGLKTIHDGTQFWIAKRGQSWTKIRLENGEEGWILNGDFLAY